MWWGDDPWLFDSLFCKIAFLGCRCRGLPRIVLLFPTSSDFSGEQNHGEQGDQTTENVNHSICTDHEAMSLYEYMKECSLLISNVIRKCGQGMQWNSCCLECFFAPFFTIHDADACNDIASHILQSFNRFQCGSSSRCHILQNQYSVTGLDCTSLYSGWVPSLSTASTLWFLSHDEPAKIASNSGLSDGNSSQRYCP